MLAAQVMDGSLRPVSELGGGRPHGTRLRYLAGCKCFQCRRSNSDYERARSEARAAGDWNGTVSAASARRHLEKLSAAGVGRRAVAAASNVGATIIANVRSGRQTRIRARSERKILAVTVDLAFDGATVPAAATWRRIEWLIEEGFTKIRIAEAIGQKRALQLGKDRVTVKHAAAIKRLYERFST